MRLALCDDDNIELSRLTHFIEKYNLSRHVNCEYVAFSSGFELLSALEKGEHFDIYCLDIIMPSFSGIDAAREIRRLDKHAPILFLTASPDFALESYSVKAENYILKPVIMDVLFRNLDEILEQLKQETKDSIILKSTQGIQTILVANLVYAEVIGRKVFYHLISGRTLECTESFSATWEKLLPYSVFIKPHRSYIINMNYIDTIDTTAVTTQTQVTIPIAQGKTKEIKEAYLTYQQRK